MSPLAGGEKRFDHDPRRGCIELVVIEAALTVLHALQALVAVDAESETYSSDERKRR